MQNPFIHYSNETCRSIMQYVHWKWNIKCNHAYKTVMDMKFTPFGVSLESFDSSNRKKTVA